MPRDFDGVRNVECTRERGDEEYRCVIYGENSKILGEHMTKNMNNSRPSGQNINSSRVVTTGRDSRKRERIETMYDNGRCHANSDTLNCREEG